MKVLITGASGNIGKKLQTHFAQAQTHLTIVTLDKSASTQNQINLGLFSPALVHLLSDIDAIIHLAADPHENKSWDELQESNLDASFNLFTAAIQAKVPRIIFASSNHVMGGYRTERGVGKWLTTSLPPKPGTKLINYDGSITDSTAYGAMKYAVERMGATYAAATNGICIAIRIGWVNPINQNRPEDLPEHADIWFKQMWLSNRDLGQLFEKAATTNLAPGFYLINGMSDNQDMVWDIHATEELLGYTPTDALETKP